MQIALIGYGKMGKTIKKMAEERGHTISYIIEKDAEKGINVLNTENTDVAIEFSQPESAVQNILACITQGIPVISGTTGWIDQLPEVEYACKANDGTFFYASNFSIGVNVFFKLNKYLAQLMNGQTDYNVRLQEIHHTEKKDSPSGTALTLIKDILPHQPTLNGWEETTEKPVGKLPIESIREGKVPGTHSITYTSRIDQITIKHEAFGREGFALGAILVAEWIKDKKGMLSMENFLSF